MSYAMEYSSMSEEKSSLVKGFGSRLRTEREAREITLEEISRVTKISIHLLHAMENDDWDALPGGIFTRNFIRLYADHIGLDAERWVDEFSHFIKVKSKAESGEGTDEDTAEIRTAELPQGWLWALAVFTVILLIGGYFVISYLRDSSSNGQPRNEMPQQAEPATTQQTPRQTSSTSTSSEQAIITDEKEWEGITIELTERDRARCWFQWWGDGSMQSPAEGENLLQGVARSLKANEKIRLNIAHMQGVEIAINGRAVAWRDLNPQPITREDGIVTSYVITIEKAQLEPQP